MESAFIPLWCMTPDGRTLYDLSQPDRIIEHQQLGTRYMVHELELRTFADRLHVAGLRERLTGGILSPLSADAHAARVSNMERLERWDAPRK